MKTSVIAGTAIIALLVAGIASVAFAQSVTSLQAPQGEGLGGKFQTKHPDRANVGQANRGDRRGQDHPLISLTLGQTLTFSGLTGHFINADNKDIRGDASGSFTFTVTGVFRTGYTLSITSGTFKIGDKTYTVTGGSAELFGRWITGSGTAGPGVNFLIRVGIHGVSTTSLDGRVMLDVKDGATEFLVGLKTAPA